MSVALERDFNPDRLPPVPSKHQGAASMRLRKYIELLEQACEQDPQSADLRTCLGLAHERNHDLGKSMARLEEAMAIDETHFFARIRYAGLFYRLRSLRRAEMETRKALSLAHNSLEFNMARRQLQKIRSSMRRAQDPICELTTLWMLPPVCLFSVGLLYRLAGVW